VQRNPLVIVVIAVVVAGMLFFGLQMARRAKGPGPPEIKGRQAPEFELTALDGKKVRLADFKGKAVLLNFWATFCQPCKIEMPWFVDLQNKYGPEGLQIVGVAMDDASEADIGKFAKNLGVNYPILIGQEKIGEDYGGIPFLPTTFYISRDGKVVDKVYGLKGKAEIEESVKKALSQGGSVQAQK
jgi:peroxiredoxin